MLFGKATHSIEPNVGIESDSIDLVDVGDCDDVYWLADRVLGWRFINFCQKVDRTSDIKLVARNRRSIYMVLGLLIILETKKYAGIRTAR